MKMITVHAAPSEYILQEGALEFLEEKLLARGISSAIIVTGEKSWAAAKVYWPSVDTIQTEVFVYNGECSLSEIERLKKSSQHVDAIIGVGGGKVVDLAKATANEVHKQVIIVPTLASNCAPWTPLSVLYNDEGIFTGYEVYPVSTSLLIVEPAICLAAPRELFVAGIGDTLAKWYEADVQLRSIEHKTVPLFISHHSAKACKDILIKESSAALEAVDTQIMNESFVKVVEVMFMYAGMVGGYGDHYGRTAADHSIHNGLTALEGSHHILHGIKVAYGIIVQLMLEERLDEITALTPFYEALNLPKSLREMSLENVMEDELKQVALKAILPTESIHLMPLGDISVENIVNILTKLN